MTPKEYLQSRSDEIYSLDCEITRKRERYRALTSRLTGSAAPGDGMPHGGGSNGPQNALCALADLGADIDRSVNRLAELKTELANEINTVKRPEWRGVLELRYVDRMAWRRIARTMNYSEKYTIELHGKALVHFKPI